MALIGSQFETVTAWELERYTPEYQVGGIKPAGAIAEASSGKVWRRLVYTFVISKKGSRLLQYNTELGNTYDGGDIDVTSGSYTFKLGTGFTYEVVAQDLSPIAPGMWRETIVAQARGGWVEVDEANVS